MVLMIYYSYFKVKFETYKFVLRRSFLIKKREKLSGRSHVDFVLYPVLNCRGNHFAIFEIFALRYRLILTPHFILEYFWKNPPPVIYLPSCLLLRIIHFRREDHQNLSVVRSNRINKFHKLIQILSFKFCYLSNKEE